MPEYALETKLIKALAQSIKLFKYDVSAGDMIELKKHSMREVH